MNAYLNSSTEKLIDVCSPFITDAELQELKGIQNLSQLGLEGTQTTEAGEMELKKSLPNLKIRR